MITLPAALRVCMRCSGLVVDDEFEDGFHGLRCVNCGWQGDQVTTIWTIIMNELEEDGS